MRSPRLLEFQFALAAFCFGCFTIARADDPDAMVTITCDTANAELRIDEQFEEAPDDAPYPREVTESDTKFSMRGLAWAKELDGQVVWESKQLRRTCALGSDKYIAVFSAYKPNWNVQGECGAGTSTVSITLTHNDEAVFQDLVLHQNCRSDEEIEYVRVLNRTSEVIAMVSGRNSDQPKYARVHATKRVSREELLSAAVPAAAP